MFRFSYIPGKDLLTQDPFHHRHVASEDEEDEEQVFVPSPLLSLKEQIEKDNGP